ncbi:MAG: Possibl zinc metallo-peptidase [candidate division WS6 bacterium OLB20]|uniref:Possibl zinc metallo-peptidase n=1 Tax=candidate division WS6 bacterium OLB20 TaxID=1617426 RepID=A0A136LYH6_9BACT|nr:MAG: Possibl zinc metallo-peptidase [candidate division WS6 bacterium OLB20]
MDREIFESYVSEALQDIPEEFRRHLENVEIVLEEFPTGYQMHKMRLIHKWQLFGLYEGVPLPRRGSGYAGVLPDKITLFMIPILRFATSEEHLKRIITNVVWHEIGHYFGMNEEEVRAMEKRRGVSYT